MSSKLRPSLILKGMAMGIAEVIPGVSGGTIAFITGIYKELIDTIKSFDIDALRLISKGDFKSLGVKLNLTFLLLLIIGMLGGIVLGIFGISHLLETNPEILWGFFFGLIIASVPMMLSTIQKRNVKVYLLFILGAIVAFVITSLTPAEANTSLPYIFISGMIAIVALVLPGISGSFILLLLGMYTFIIPTLKQFLTEPNGQDLLVIAVFGSGCLIGLLFFVRLISKAFEKHFDITVAIMSGFMLGSLNKIWPWRNIQSYLDKDNGKIISTNGLAPDLSQGNYKVISELNVLPSHYHNEPKAILVICAFLLGVALIAILNKQFRLKTA